MTPRRLLVAAGGAALFITGVPATAAAAPTPPARVVTLQPRIIDLEARVIDLKPKRTKNTYTVDSDVLFAFDSAKLSTEAAHVLDDVLETLEKRKATKVEVVGHTDSIGSTSYNQSLSQRRAKAVRDHLQQQVTEPTYTSRGRGESSPVAANQKPDGSDNPEGRRKNRRVVITYTAG